MIYGVIINNWDEIVSYYKLTDKELSNIDPSHLRRVDQIGIKMIDKIGYNRLYCIDINSDGASYLYNKVFLKLK